MSVALPQVPFGPVGEVQRDLLTNGWLARVKKSDGYEIKVVADIFPTEAEALVAMNGWLNEFPE